MSVVVKLFLIMGINWLAEYLSFMINWPWDAEIAVRISIFTDIVNLLQVLTKIVHSIQLTLKRERAPDCFILFHSLTVTFVKSLCN